MSPARCASARTSRSTTRSATTTRTTATITRSGCRRSSCRRRGRRCPGSPDWLNKSVVTASYGGFDVQAIGDYIGGRYTTYTNDLSVDPYFTLALRLAWTLPDPERYRLHALTVSLNVTNVTNIQAQSTLTIGAASNTYNAFPLAPAPVFRHADLRLLTGWTAAAAHRMVPRMTPAVRATVLACLYFAGFGCLIPFLPLWLEKVHGFSGAEIGVVLAIAAFSRAVAGPLTAAWADGRSDRRAPLFMFTILLTAGFVVLRFVTGFVAVFALILILDIAFWGLLPVVETTLLRLTRSGRPSYGLARGLASAAFVAGTTAVGFMDDAFGSFWPIWGFLLAVVGGDDRGQRVDAARAADGAGRTRRAVRRAAGRRPWHAPQPCLYPVHLRRRLDPGEHRVPLHRRFAGVDQRPAFFRQHRVAAVEHRHRSRGRLPHLPRQMVGEVSGPKA